MPLEVGLGKWSILKFEGVRASMGIMLVVTLCWLALKQGSAEATGAVIMLATSVVKDYISFKTQEANNHAKPPA